MKTLVLHLLTSSLIILSGESHSQNRSGLEIKGIVIDSLSKKPLDYITISLKSDKGLATSPNQPN